MPLCASHVVLGFEECVSDSSYTVFLIFWRDMPFSSFACDHVTSLGKSLLSCLSFALCVPVGGYLGMRKSHAQFKCCFLVCLSFCLCGILLSCLSSTKFFQTTSHLFQIQTIIHISDNPLCSLVQLVGELAQPSLHPSVFALVSFLSPETMK